MTCVGIATRADRRLVLFWEIRTGSSGCIMRSGAFRLHPFDIPDQDQPRGCLPGCENNDVKTDMLGGPRFFGLYSKVPAWISAGFGHRQWGKG